jgi:thiamine-phosphate pyrophosphorylase
LKGEISGLYFVVNSDIRREKVPDIVLSSLKGGVDLVQIICETDKADNESLKKIRRITRDYGVPFLCNDSIKLAENFETDGLHLDYYNIRPNEVRKKFGSNFIVGYTVGNNIDKAMRAEREAADYISFCSVFKTDSATYCDTVPLQKLKSVKRILKIPVFASGGINEKNFERVLRTGIDGIAVTSAIQSSKDPEDAARRLKKIIVKFLNLSR